MCHDRTGKADSPAAHSPISDYERQVLWHLAAFVVNNESGKLIGSRRDDSQDRLSWEAPAARRNLEDWFRLIDDLGWDEIPSGTAVLTDTARYRPMLEEQRKSAEGELAGIAEARRRGERVFVAEEEEEIANEDLEIMLVCDQILRRMPG